MAVKVGMVSLGCAKNQVDSEIMLSLIRGGGYELCTDAGLCDVVVINTCGFIEDAKKESIENILEFCTLKNEGRVKAVVVTGCLAERYRWEVAREIPEADVILGIGKNTEIVEAVGRALAGERVVSFGEKSALPLSGERILSNLPFFAYLKIAEGCSNRCSYCAIPMIRGDYRSRPFEEIIEEARRLVDGGVRELNIVAQDPTRYGEDLYGRSRLCDVVSALCQMEDLRWLRLLYLYPERISDELIDVIAREDKVVKYIDMPIQHCSRDILRAMNRPGDRDGLLALTAKLRARIPGVVLRTTLICGFPGETEEDFEQLREFVGQARFERLGCFPYSPEEGTGAALLPGQVDEETRRRRCELIMERQMDIMGELNNSLLGSTLEVVTEGYDRHAGSYFGRSYMDAPDIDAKTFFTRSEDKTDKLCAGDFVRVRIGDTVDYDLLGVTED